VEKTEVKVEKAEVKSPTGVVLAEDDPFSAIWDFLEGGVNLVSEALGLPTPDCASPDTKDADQEVKRDIDEDHALYTHPGGNAFVTSKPTVAVEVQDVEVDQLSPLDATMSHAAEWLLGGGLVDPVSST
jgi:hypothetical protein